MTLMIDKNLEGRFSVRFWWMTLFVTVLKISAAPIDAPDPVYFFLRRLEVRQALPRPYLGSLPFPRTEVVSLLHQAQADSANLTPFEQHELARYLAEFDPEVQRQSSRLHYQNGNAQLFGNVQYSASILTHDSLPDRTTRLFTIFKPHAEGSLTQNFSFVSEASVASEKSNANIFLMNYNPQRGLPYNTNIFTDSLGKPPAQLDDALTTDAFRTVVSWRGEGYGIEVGNDWNQWGPGNWQHPTFSARPWFWVNDSLPASPVAGFEGTLVPGSARSGYRSPGESAPMTQVRMDLSWRSLKYTKFIAEKIGLNSASPSPSHVVAHRLEVRLGDNWLLGLDEMVVYSGRSFELTYAVPFVPLKFAEHQVGDLDNAGMGFDIDYRLPWSARIYSELFLDDLLGPLKILENWWGNKYAWVLGGEAYDWIIPASCLQVEWAHVEPWLYGHTVYNNQMQHYGALLGSALPPNSQAVWLRWTQEFPNGFSTGLEYGFLQRQLRARGSSIFDVHANILDGTGKNFLGENPETRNGIEASISGRFKRYMLAKISGGYFHVNNWKDEPGVALSGFTEAAQVTLSY